MLAGTGRSKIDFSQEKLNPLRRLDDKDVHFDVLLRSRPRRWRTTTAFAFTMIGD